MANFPGIYGNDRYTQQVMELLLRRGDIEANRAAQSGQLWGNAVADIGQIGAEALQAHAEQQKQKKAQLALDTALQNADPSDPWAIYRATVTSLGPERAMSIARGVAEIHKAQQGEKPTPEGAKMVLKSLKSAIDVYGDEGMTERWPGYVQALQPYAPFVGGVIPGQYTPEVGKFVTNYVAELEGKPEGAIVETVDASGKPIRRRATEMELAAGVPTYQKPAEYRVTEPGPNGPVTRLASEAEMRAGVREYQRPPAALVVNPEKEEDAKTLAQQLIDGRTTPATLSKRGDYNHILALADRLSQQQGKGKLNPTKLQLDYSSAARHVAAMNGPQMVRFRSLAESVVNTMDEVKALAEELKQGGVQKWNQAKRDTVLEVYGNTPQSGLAARYISAVNTLKEEFANLAQGGYAPTEDAWRLAEQQINGNYGLKDMVASITEAQRLINYRMDAFTNLTPQFIGGQGSVGGALGAQPTAPSTGGSWIDMAGGRIREK